jgi:hypothetical protein
MTSVSNGEESTYLTRNLSRDGDFRCTGSKPWVHDLGSGCGYPIRAALRGAGNVYFPLVESAIFLPPREGAASAEVLDILRRSDVYELLRMAQEFNSLNVEFVRTKKYELVLPFTDEELDAGLSELFRSPEDGALLNGESGDDLTSGPDWRYPEYDLLRSSITHPDLQVRESATPRGLQRWMDRVRRVEVLRETRVLRGFTRFRYSGLKLNEGKLLLRRRALPPSRDWLPAYVVRGEGIYLELDHPRLSNWETRGDIRARVAKMSSRLAAVQRRKGLPDRELSPRFILIHTLAHLLINELVLTCGYSSAALRERLYVSDVPGREMAGVLIYTAAGDSEGTMGGLVRMGNPENLGPVVTAAILNARWCSTDPVCMELGEAGQGPDSCNMAACHGCALIPETSCEEFNQFLDRGLVIGTFDDPDSGYFSALLGGAV